MSLVTTNDYLVWIVGKVNTELYDKLEKPRTVLDLTQDVDETVQFAMGGRGMLFEQTQVQEIGEHRFSFLLMVETPKDPQDFKDNISVALEVSEIFSTMMRLDVVLLGTYPIGSKRER